MNFFQAKLKVVTVFGAGLLVGTALTVIIPEGIRSIYGDVIAKAAQNHNQHFAMTTNSPSSAMAQQQNSSDGADGTTEHSGTIGLSLVLGSMDFFVVFFCTLTSCHVYL